MSADAAGNASEGAAGRLPLRPALSRWHRTRRRWRETRRRWRHSIKARLVGLFVLLALATSATFLYGLQRAVQGGWLAYAQPLGNDYLDRLAAEIGTPPDAARAAALAARLPITLRIEGPLLNYSSHPPSAAPRRRRPTSSDEHDFGAADWGLVRHTIDGHRITFGLAQPEQPWRTRGIGWITLAVLLVLTAVAYAAVSRLLRPLADITRGVSAFGAGDFARPIEVRRRDELGDLATRVNAMARGLHGMLEAKRLLLLAISHELRSPLTRARLNAELLPEGAERSALLHDLGEMRDLITDLIEGERLAAGHAALHTAPTDLAALAAQCVADEFAGEPIELNLQAGLAPQQADVLRLRLALRNLVANALRHGRVARKVERGAAAAGASNGSAPMVFVRRESDGAIALGVRDHGPGVPDAQLARLGDAFYRPDDARSRSSGGVGLGLHLCRLVALAHGGQLRLRNAEPGLEASIVWPASAP